MAGMPKRVNSQAAFSKADIIMAAGLLLSLILAVCGAVAAWAAIDQRLDQLESNTDRLIQCFIDDYARCRRAEEAE